MYCYSLAVLLPQRDHENLKTQKWTGHYVRKKKKTNKYPYLRAVRTDLRTRPVNGLIHIRQPHVNHHGHPHLFSKFAEQIANHLFPSFHPKETSDSGGRERVKKERKELQCACAGTKKLREANEMFLT